MNDPARILLLEDDPHDAMLIEREVRRTLPGASVLRVETGDAFLAAFDTFAPDLILSDAMLPSFDGMEALHLAREQAPDVPFVMVADCVDAEAAVACMKSGAWDYVCKDHIDRLGGAVRDGMNRKRVLAGQRAAEAALRDSEAQLRRAQEIGLLGNWRLDVDGSMTWSDQMYRNVDLSPDSRIDIDRFFSRVLPDDRAALRAWLRSCWAGEQPPEIEFRIVAMDSSIRSLLARGGGERDATGAVARLSGMTLDITVRKTAELALLAAKEHAEKSERLKDAFIMNISHELRTPLNIILGYTEMMQDKYRPTAEPSDLACFESILRGGQRLMRTVDMILNISRLQVGEFTPRYAEIPLPLLLRKLVEDYRPIAARKQLAMTFSDDCGDALIVADEYCITQAVGNLLDNAVKFTMHGGVDLRVFRNADDRVCVSCRDTGIGISNEYLPLLFTRYTQEATGAVRSYEGLGLGLALVKEYLAINGASISVVSEKGCGSTFTIVFDGSDPTIADDGAAQAADEDVAAPLAAAAMQESHPAVLVVEDDQMTLDFMRIILAGPYEFHAARNAAEAWQVLHARKIDIILMDISLSDEQGGIDLTYDIRQHHAYRTVPIIAVTAHAYGKDRQRCLDVGCDDFLTKPVKRSVLLRTMERHLAH